MDLKITFDLMPVLGCFLSLLAWIVPPYQKLSPQAKQWVLIGAIVGVDVVVMAGSLLDFWTIYQFSRWQDWVMYPITDMVAALLASFGTYGASRKILEKATNKEVG